MKINKFEEIIAWQRAQDLAVEIYSLFKDSKDFGFRDQICRAVVSISNNIAEGFDRKTDADFSRFLYISFSSCSEVKSMVYLSERLSYINKKTKEELICKSDEVQKLISGFIKSLKPSTNKTIKINRLTD
ncbi:MAG: four helix bundle protein [Clostridia bacterium]|nr:four helix bundle protein [Clostridia bacterium]